MIDAARPSRHVPGDRWFVDETYLKVTGRWVYVYRAVDQHGQVIDVLASPKRDLAATRRFFARALNAARRPTEVTTDPGPGVPACARRAGSRGVSRCGAIRQQPDRIRSWPVRGPDSSDAAGWSGSAAPRWSVAGTRSFRTCAADTTNSDTTLNPAAGLRRSSPNLPSPSEPCLHPRSLLPPPQRNSGDQNTGTVTSWPASTAPAVVSVSGLTAKCWVTAWTSRSRRCSGQST